MQLKILVINLAIFVGFFPLEESNISHHSYAMSLHGKTCSSKYLVEVKF